VINAGAVNIAMLIVGRMLLGFGIGFTFQVWYMIYSSGLVRSHFDKIWVKH
jgi:predicted MFS family arabinose efflux permease